MDIFSIIKDNNQRMLLYIKSSLFKFCKTDGGSSTVLSVTLLFFQFILKLYKTHSRRNRVILCIIINLLKVKTIFTTLDINKFRGGLKTTTKREGVIFAQTAGDPHRQTSAVS